MNKKLVIRIVLILLISLLIGFGAFTISRNLTGKTGDLPFGVGIYVVRSGSMEPALSYMDVIIVVKDDKYEPKEVVVFTDGTSNVVHRIKTVDGDEVITRGDANNTDDDPIKMSDIKGEVKLSIPYLGYVLDFVRSTPVTIALIAFVAWAYIWTIKKEKEEKLSEKEQLAREIEDLKKELDK